MKKYLADTQVLLWMSQQPDNLSISAKNIMESESEIFLSYVSIWEIAIKIKIQKLNIEGDLDSFINSSLEKYDFKLLPISLDHIYYTRHLPLNHRDPFDRLIIAQSFSENMPVISADEAFDAYNVNRIWK